MNEKWRPKPPRRNRSGALGFIFVLLLFVVIAALLFLLNPASQSAGRGDLPVTPVDQTPGSSLSGGTPKPAAPGQRWDLFLPLIRS